MFAHWNITTWEKETDEDAGWWAQAWSSRGNVHSESGWPGSTLGTTAKILSQASLPTHLYFWKQPLCEHLLSRSPFICASKGRVGERYASDVRRAQHAFTAFPRPQNYLYASSRRRRVNSSGLSVVYKLNFSSHDLQIVNESSVLLHTGDVLSEAFWIFERCQRGRRRSTSNETVSAVLKEACYARASLPPQRSSPPLHPLWLAAQWRWWKKCVVWVCLWLSLNVSLCMCVCVCLRGFWFIITEAPFAPLPPGFSSFSDKFFLLFIFFLTTGFWTSVCFHIANQDIPQTWRNLFFVCVSLLFLTQFPLFLSITCVTVPKKSTCVTDFQTWPSRTGY